MDFFQNSLFQGINIFDDLHLAMHFTIGIGKIYPSTQIEKVDRSLLVAQVTK
jgi:hypothetical protein